MTNSELSSKIEMALLESPAVARVLAIAVAGPEGSELIGVRASILGAVAAADVMPVIANLRQLVREAAPGAAEIFIEVDPTQERAHDVSTEAIVIRSMD